jgi:S1-C subfamily serine protease
MEVHVLLQYSRVEPLGIACNSQLIVRTILEGSPAAKVVQAGDRIIRVNDSPIDSLQTLTRVVAATKTPTILFVLIRECVASLYDNCTLQPGNKLITVELLWSNEGPRLGLAIKQVTNCNVVQFK